MKDFVIVHMLEDYKLDRPFSIWPFHLTIMLWFTAPSQETVVKIVRPIIQKTAKIHLQVSGITPFGAKSAGTNMISSPELAELHNNLLEALRGSDFEIIGRYVGPHFLPHITTKLGKHYDKSDITIDKIQLAESLPQGYRKIVAEIELGAN